MRCYVDSSVLLRKLLRQSRTLVEWPEIQEAYSSRLLRLECFRTIDRFRLNGILTDEMLAQRRAELFGLLANIAVLPLTESILTHAEQSFAVSLGTLDSVHLSTAMLWNETRGDDLVFATHDNALALAAKAHGFTVIGV